LGPGGCCVVGENHNKIFRVTCFRKSWGGGGSWVRGGGGAWGKPGEKRGGDAPSFYGLSETKEVRGGDWQATGGGGGDGTEA